MTASADRASSLRRHDEYVSRWGTPSVVTSAERQGKWVLVSYREVASGDTGSETWSADEHVEVIRRAPAERAA